MKNNNYPNWLVPLDIAKKLKDLKFNLNCYFYREEGRNGKDLIKSPFSLSQDALRNYNNSYYDTSTSVPTWEQVFEWFREKGFESYIRLESHAHFDEGNYYYFEITKSNLRQLDWQGDFDDYNEAREALVKALIQTYKNEQL